MADQASKSDDRTDGSRMMIEPDSVHEGEDGIFLDCPKCGSNVSIGRIVSTGRCSNSIDGEKDAVQGDDSSADDCDAHLALELVWES
ncbi:hypothetical protein [Haloarcula montana]|uniref:hypothetical protein n=1 Tax=Haloarcula montana TaxID=3111776 RepID=UPI002D7688D9|nr:hypothetical protein [Haloarcula sp. GH36]